MFAEAACRAPGVEPRLLASHRKDRSTTRLRELVAAVGLERWGQSAGELGRVLGTHPDVVSRWARRAATRRAEDPAIADQHQALDLQIAASNPEARGR